MKDFITDLIKKNIHIDLVEGELSVRFPKNGVDQLILAELKAKKQAIKDYLSGLEKDRFVVIPALTVAESYPISDAQRRLWVLSQFEGGSAAYNLAGSIALNQDIDIEKFKKAIAATIERHEILRTVFKTDELGEVRQWILQQGDLGFEIGYGDFRKSQDKQQQVEAYIKQDTYKPFDLEHGPLLRAGLLQLDDASYVFYINMHHIICDGWSLEVLSRDVFSYYESYKNNKQSGLKALRIQYKDYSSWQLAQLKKESFKAHREYWLDNLKGELPLVDLPAGKQRPRVKTNNGYGLSIYIDSRTSHKLKAYAGANGGSLFMSLLAAWNILLYRYTSQKDIIIGTPIAGREHADLEDQIGFYVNTLALRNEIIPAESFNDFYKKLKDNTLKSYSHQAYPFDRLVDDLHLQRDTSRSVVFDMLLVQNYGEKVQGPALTKEQISQVADLGYSASKFDIELSVKEISDYLLLNVVYNTDVYERGMVENLLRHYRQLLTALLENPEKKISHINYLLPAEKNELLLAFNDKAAEYPEHQTVVDLFEQQAIKTPGHAALVFGEKIISYKDLNESANQLAAYLRDVYKVKRGDCVGFKLERSENIIITIFGILKAGAAYLPMDIDSPEEKVNYISTDSKTVLIIDARELEIFNAQRSKYQNTNLPEPAGVEDLVYVIYTSGSTGQPKGVAIEHKGLAAHIHNVKELYGVSAKSRFLQFFNVAFDAAAQEIFTSLCFGATLYLKAPEVDPEYIYDLIAKHKITHADFSTAFFNSFIASFKPGRFTHKMDFCAVGGEKLEKGTVEKQLANIASFTKNFYNVYGPTETTLTATWFGIIKNGKLSGLDAVIPIGRPYAGRQVLIVDEHQQLLPKEVIGEICIGGAGLARGYLNQEALSKEKFIASPFKAGGRLYKTGDLGRWLPGGNIEFIGRKDDQVKIRGYRIELGEIEHALLRHEQLTGAVVLVKKNEQNEKELVAYITAQAAQNTSALRSFLQKILPEYMVPAYYVQLEALPLTSNGKVNKKLLPDPQGLGLSSGIEYVAPRTEQEKVLVAVWTDVLKREGIGVKDSFYNLGGDSIKSIQVVSRLKQQGYTLKVENILRTPVLEELAMLMQQSIQVIDQSEVNGAVELTPIQHWFFEALEIKVHAHFNQSVLLHSKEQLDKNIIEKSIAELVRHHDALRMVYKNEAGVWKQINQDTTTKSYTINFYDLSRADDAPGQMSQIGEALQASIDLGKGPLFKVVHFKLKDSDRLGLIIHHLVVDGVSWRILLEDLSTLYINYKAGKKAELPLKTDSFQRWALLQKEYAKGDAIKKEKAYWETLCSQKIQSLPQDKKIKEKQAVIDASESFRLDKATTELLQTRVHGIYNTKINDVLLTGLGLAIKEVFGRDKSVLKMEGHGREELVAGVDISRTVGWFTTTYPFVLDVSETVHPTESLVAVKESLRKVPNKGIGYGILNYLSKALGNPIKPEILFNYLGDFGTHAGHDKKAMFDYASESIGLGIAKENGNHAVLDVSGIMVAGELSLSVGYSQSRYDSATIRALVKSYEKNLKSLIKELSKSKTTYLTPSDLSFKGLSIEELSKINPGNNVEDVYELSPMQEGIYYHWLAEESSSLYFEQSSYRVRAKGLEIEKLKQAYEGLIARHGVLRTSFSMDYAGRPLQIVRKSVPGNYTYEKIKGKAGKQNFVEQVKQKDREKGFDLTSPSQMRLQVIDLGEDAYEFIWSFHHILMDGWCMSVLINDFNELLSGNALNLSPVIPYSNYIHWIKTLNKESSLAYWKNYLADYSQVAEVPFKIKTSKTVYAEKRESLKIEGALFKKLDSLCHQTGITHNTFIQGVWGYLLSLYNNTNDVVFGAVVSGRPAELQGVEEMVGLFINAIPVRVKYEPNNTPFELLKALQEQSIQSTSHHYVNLSEVQSQSEPGKNLVDHIMIFENYAVKELTSESLFNTQKEEGLSIEAIEVFEQTNYDFNITVTPLAGSFTITIAYNANQYDSLLLERVRGHFDTLIRAFTEHADEPLHTLNYLSEAEKHELLYTFNNTATAYPKNKTIVDLFEEQAAKTPDHVSVVFEEKELTYRELNEQSNQLAQYLKKNYAIQPDDLVAIKLERSEWMIVSILGVLKSGGAYVPIDPNYPQERMDYIIKDAGCKVCIDEKVLTEFRQDERKYSKDKVASLTEAGNLAYVIYTSGSTGKPKGVMIEHKNVINFFTGMASVFCEERGTFLSMTNFTFDISVLELLWTLSKGYKVVIQGDVKEISGRENNRPLDFSLFYFGNAEEGNDNYKLLIEGAKYADDNGYAAVWTPERHFHEFGGLYPNPSLMAAALCSITKNVAIRAGSVVFPLHHPIRIAEDWSVIDNLSGGRAGIACASGWHADDFVLSPGNYKNRNEVMYQSIHTMRKLWKGEGVTFENGNGHLKETKIFPKPVQAELPLWITSSGSVDTFISAGKLGVNVLTHLLGGTLEGLADKIIAYRKAYTESGHDGKNAKVTLMLHTYIDDEANIEKKARQPFINYIKSSAGLIQRLVTDLDEKAEIDKLSDKELDALYEYAYRRFVSTASMVGTMETCFKMLKKLSSIGVDEIASLVDFGVDYESAMESMKKLTALKDRYNASGSDYSVYSQIKKHKVTHLQITPSMGGILNQHLTKDQDWNSMKTILLGGERLTMPLVKNLHEKLPQVKIYNMYGPTETTIWSTVSVVDKSAEKVLIGKPIANTSIYIFNEKRHLLPIGIQGEIYIGGEGVARGYTNKELTEQRFIENPYKPGERLYRTGDFGSWLSDSSIDYSGRKDEQVKIRGYRIELGEIEHALLKNEHIEEAVVIAKENEEGGKELVAYIAGHKKQNAGELRIYLKELLPEYMLPAHFIQLEALPLNTSGKIDRKALPDPKDLDLLSGTEYIAPRNEMEEKLLKIWQDVLQREHIGVKDDFFVLGGHSLRATQLIIRLEKSLGIKIGLRNFLAKPTIEDLSEAISTLNWMKDKSEEVNAEQDEIII